VRNNAGQDGVHTVEEGAHEVFFDLGEELGLDLNSFWVEVTDPSLQVFSQRVVVMHCQNGLHLLQAQLVLGQAREEGLGGHGLFGGFHKLNSKWHSVFDALVLKDSLFELGLQDLVKVRSLQIFTKRGFLDHF
jgi:hypothetical protein